MISPYVIDLTGKRYGRLVVRSFVGTNKHKGALWLCDCDCGQQATVSSNHLRERNTKSCGCLWSEINTGITLAAPKKQTRLYMTWSGMKARCDSPKHIAYPNYGGRGITYCDEWQDFPPFYRWAHENGYKHGLTLDRIDIDGNYQPDNCRWATRRQQANNKRNNRTISFQGKSLTVAQWAREIGLPYATLHCRLSRGWSVEEALTTDKIPRTGPRKQSKSAKVITFRGKSRTMAGWAKATGISCSTISRRLKGGWSAEKALTTPPLADFGRRAA